MNYKTEAKPKAMAGNIPVFCAHDEIKPIEELIPNPKNPNRHPDDQIALLARIIAATGWRQPITVSKRSGFIVKGHGRLMAAKEGGFSSVPVDFQSYANEAEEYADLVADNRLAELSEIDNAMLGEVFKDIDLDEIPAELTGYTEDQINDLLAGLAEDLEDEQPGDPEEIEVMEPISREGDIWVLGGGRHRLMCGDSTDAGAVFLLADGQKADFIHADPPYGLGKVAEGVQNDDKRKDELVKFQLDWIKAFRPHTIEKICIAILGYSEELWRLWFLGLQNLEKMRFANEIVWNKPDSQGKGCESATLTRSERCLIVQTGEQFLSNINSEYFPEAWRPTLSFMQAEAKAAGLKPKDLKEKTGTSMYGHWFTESQFTLIPENHYKTLAEAYPGHFLRPWQDLKQEWDKVSSKKALIESGELTRVHYDTAFEPMDDVWTFTNSYGEARPDHPTPKKIDLMRRMVKLCCPEDGLILEPFSGSGQTLLAAEQTGRRCYAMELTPKYVDMGVRRWIAETGSRDVKLIRNGEEQPTEVFAEFFDNDNEQEAGE